MDLFLAEFFGQYPTGKFHLARLTSEAKDFFGVSNEDASLLCERAHGAISPTTTRLEQLAHWGCMHLLDKHTIKRTAPSEYQHMAGPDKLYRTLQERQSLLGEATAFFKHSRSLGFTLEQTKVMWFGRWDNETTAKAAEVAFS
jgi:hypothetical protein